MEKTRAQSDLPVWRKIQKTLQNLPTYIYGCLEMAKKVYSSIVLCMRKILVRSVQVLCINVVIASKKVTEKVKKWGKIAILWFFEP